MYSIREVDKIQLVKKIVLSAFLVFVLGTQVWAQNHQNYDINQHGQACRAEIGPIPSFNCLDGEVIPITNNGAAVLSEADLGPNRTCDKPPWLSLGGSGQCISFSRLGRLPAVNSDGVLDENIQWVFVCRRYNFRPENSNIFDDVAVIGHNRSTGATCFFQALTNLDGQSVPTPTSDDSSVQSEAIDFWLKPVQTAHILGGGPNSPGCDNCHDSDPFIHSPYVDQVKLKDQLGNVVLDGEGDPVTLVPRNYDLPLFYKHVGDPFLPPDQDGLWPVPTKISPLDDGCTGCHSQQAPRTNPLQRILQTKVFGKAISSSAWMKS